MGLTRMFKLANYLMRKKAAFATVVANIRDHKTLPPDDIERIALMFEECGTDTLLIHPETLVIGMNCYLGDDVTWKILAGILQTHMPDFTITDLHAYGLKKLGKYDRCNNGKIKGVILDELSSLREGDLERVKLLLSWEIVKDYGHITLTRIENSSPRRLTDQIVSRYSDHAAYVMALIFTQIQHRDLVEDLTATARVRCNRSNPR